MKHTCGNEMRDLGQWPSQDNKTIVNKFHCPTCNDYTSVDVPGFKLVQNPDGTLRQVPTE